MFDFKKFLKKEEPKTLEQMFKSKLLSEEEFLRFRIVQKEMSLRKVKTKLAKFLKGKK